MPKLGKPLTPLIEGRQKEHCQGQEIRDNEQWVDIGGVWERWRSAVERWYSVDYLRRVLGRNQNR